MIPMLLFMMFVLSYSIDPKPKFCVNCKYFSPSNNNFYTNTDRCNYFQYSSEDDIFLITGVKKENQIKNIHCSTARIVHSLCGPTGKYYRKKYTKKQ